MTPKQSETPGAAQVTVSSWRSRAGWLLSLLTCILIGFVWTTEPDEVKDPDGAEANGDLQIERIQPLEASPGGALAISYSGSDPHGAPISVTLDKQELQILFSSRSRLVARVPGDVSEGRAKIRLVQGEARSKKREVWLRGFDITRVIELGLGGVALFVLGLRTLSRGIRTYAGNRLRTLLGRLTRGVWRSFGVGLFAGAATQSTVTTTGVLVGLLSSNLLPIAMALAIILGSQLGSAAMALTVPLGSRASVLLIALGVIWVSLAGDRQQRALAKVVLGLGLLFFGFETIRTGFAPLVSHPTLVRSLGHDSASFLQTLASVLTGTLMTAVLQGPGPAFALVLGLAESSEIVGVKQGLTMLAGAPLGVALATSVVAWPFGGTPRRWAIGHLILGLLSSVVLASTAPFWADLAARLVPVEGMVPSEAALLPPVAAPLITGFLLSHGLVVSCLVLTLPRLTAWLDARQSAVLGGPSLRNQAPSAALSTDAPAADLPSAEVFSAALNNLQSALSGIERLWKTSDRSNASECERALDVTQAELTRLLSEARNAEGLGAETSFATGLALLNVRDSLAWMQRIVERGIEWGVTPEESEVSSLQRLHALVVQALQALAQGIQNRALIDVEGAREREIWLNAEDSRARAHLERMKSKLPLRYTRHWSAVSAAYEEVGNQLFHTQDALLGAADDD